VAGAGFKLVSKPDNAVRNRTINERNKDGRTSSKEKDPVEKYAATCLQGLASGYLGAC
jgi:hypothetical protein